MEENQNVATEQNEQVVEQQPQEETKPEKTFTQAELDAIVKKRLDKAEQKFNERLNQLEEAQKLAQMSEQEKQQFEFDKRIKELEQREQALLEKENAYSKQQYQNEIENQLKAKGLPTDLADLLINLDAETVAKKIDSMANAIGASVNSEIENKLKSSSIPQEPTKQPKRLLSREEIANMSLEEYRKNRDLINESLANLNK